MTYSATAQNNLLQPADSLFAKQKYTEAFEKYDEIFDQGMASPAMLTKMAFIQEGLGNYAEALYFLNLYYEKTSDKAAATKMRELAEEHDLKGYEYSDARFIANFLKKNNQLIVICLLAFSLFLLAYAFRKKKRGETPAFSLGLQLITLVLVGVLSNQWFVKGQAIVRQDNSILMTGPSAGAEPVDFVKKGNKVVIKSRDILWSEIEWGEETAFIRTKNLRLL